MAGLPEAEGGGRGVDFFALRTLLDRAQAALENPGLSEEEQHAIHTALNELMGALTSAVGAIAVGAETHGGDSGGVPSVVSCGVQTEVSTAMKPGVEVFGRRFSEVWNPSNYERGQCPTYESITNYEQFILDSDRQNTDVYVRDKTLVEEIRSLYKALKNHVSSFRHPLIFEFDEHGQHFEAHVSRDWDTQRLFIRLAASFSGDDRRYCLFTVLNEARCYGPLSDMKKVIPCYKQGEYCVLSQKLYRPESPTDYFQCENLSSSRYRTGLDSPFAQKLRRSESPANYLWHDDLSYSPESDPAFREKMALFKPVSLGLIFQLIREHVERENKSEE